MDSSKIAITLDWEPWLNMMGLLNLRMKNTPGTAAKPDAQDFARWLAVEAEVTSSLMLHVPMPSTV